MSSALNWMMSRFRFGWRSEPDGNPPTQFPIPSCAKTQPGPNRRPEGFGGMTEAGWSMAFSAVKTGGARGIGHGLPRKRSCRASEANGGAAAHLPAIMNCDPLPSRGFPVVVGQDASKTSLGLDGTDRGLRMKIGRDQPVTDALVVPLGMVGVRPVSGSWFLVPG